MPPPRLSPIARQLQQVHVRPSPQPVACLPPWAKHGRAGYGTSTTTATGDSVKAKALLFSSFGEPRSVLNLHAHTLPSSLGPSQVLLQTLAAPINPADFNTIQGTYGALPD